jgi:RNA polymerase sigma-70 factor, ECF subfamily
MLIAMDLLTGLAQRARAGDERALESFVNLAYEQVWRMCATLADPRTAEDLAQETFLRAIRALDRYEGQASARTWLLAIARHVCMDELRTRTKRRARHTPLDQTPPGQEPAVPDASQGPVVTDLIARLDPDRRLAFVLTQILGLSYQEAAQVCECPSGTIRSRLARARADLIKQLAAHENDPAPSHRSRWSSA